MSFKHLNIDIDLLKFDKSFVMDIPGKSTTKRCVCIPIEENDIYITKDENTGKAKGAYIHITAWKSREEKFGQTHYIRQSFSEEFRKQFSAEELKQRPILGNAKPVQEQSGNAAQSVEVPTVPFNESATDDLPF